ncbi:MAG: non-canonical purine NTP diphosphatase [Prevotellaceae bacterium]|jgi:XTP/dITP diphosphohydrolase|nr:non-canonical purine NTP diphosphatase [Prevotellaceae bacterium]
MERRYVFATNNAHKLEEVRAILGKQIEILSLRDIKCLVDIPETGRTLEENALIKAHYVYDNYHVDCFADDTGLEVEALGGAPGVYSARYAGEGHDFDANIRKLLHEMQGIENRAARFRTVFALIINGKEHLFEGSINGIILTHGHGRGGFGYDPLFVPNGYTQSFADMDAAQKNLISHRAVGAKKLARFLAEVK